MAEAGFYFCGTAQTPDWVRCVVCHQDMEGWEEEDDPRYSLASSMMLAAAVLMCPIQGGAQEAQPQLRLPQAQGPLQDHVWGNAGPGKVCL